jgi:hypothetical protein
MRHVLAMRVGVDVAAAAGAEKDVAAVTETEEAAAVVFSNEKESR